MSSRHCPRLSLIAFLGLLFAVGCSQEPAGLTPLQLAKLHFQSGEWDDAVADLNTAIAAEPENAEAYLLRGRTRHIIGDVTGALSDFDQTIALSPKHSEAHYQRAEALRELGEKEKADAAERLAREYDPLREETLAMTAQPPQSKPVKKTAKVAVPDEATEELEDADAKQSKPAALLTLAEREEKVKAADEKPASSGFADLLTENNQSTTPANPFSTPLDAPGNNGPTAGGATGKNPFDFSLGNNRTASGEQPAITPRTGTKSNDLDTPGNGNENIADASPTVRPSLPQSFLAPFTAPNVRSTGIGQYSPLLPNAFGQQPLASGNGNNLSGLPGLGGGPLVNAPPSTGINGRQTSSIVPGVGTSLVQDLSRQTYQSRQALRLEGEPAAERKTSLNAGLAAPLSNPYTQPQNPVTTRRTLQSAPATGNGFGNGSQFTPITPGAGPGLGPGAGPTFPPAGGGYRTFP